MQQPAPTPSAATVATAAGTVTAAVDDELHEAEAGLVRLTVKLSRSVAEALKSLAGKHGTTKTEEVRRALSLWKFLDDAREDRWSLLLERDGQFREIVVDVLRGR